MLHPDYMLKLNCSLDFHRSSLYLWPIRIQYVSIHPTIFVNNIKCQRQSDLKCHQVSISFGIRASHIPYKNSVVSIKYCIQNYFVCIFCNIHISMLYNAHEVKTKFRFRTTDCSKCIISRLWTKVKNITIKNIYQ
jgi:hypothetical protein